MMKTYTRTQLIESVQLFKAWHESHIVKIVNLLDIPAKVSRNDMATVLFVLLTGETEPELIKHRIERDKETGKVVELLTGMLQGSDRFLDMELLKIYVSRAFGTGWILLTKNNSEINDPNNIRTQLISQVFEIKKQWLARYIADMHVTYSDTPVELLLNKNDN